MILIAVLFNSMITAVLLLQLQPLLTFDQQVGAITTNLDTILANVETLHTVNGVTSPSNLKFFLTSIPVVPTGTGTQDWRSITVPDTVPLNASALSVILSTIGVGSTVLFRPSSISSATWIQSLEDSPTWQFHQGFITLKNRAFEYKTDGNGGQVVIEMVGYVV